MDLEEKFNEVKENFVEKTRQSAGQRRIGRPE